MGLSIFLGFLLVFSSLLTSSWLLLQVYYIKSLTREGTRNLADPSLQNNRKISIIVAIRDEEADTINELIENLLNVDYDNYEIIIVSDDYPKKFNELLSNIRKIKENVKIVRRDENKGRKAGALNYGVKISSGEYLVFLDAEARVERDFLIKVVRYLSQFDVIAMRLRIRNSGNCVEKAYYQMTEYSMDSLFLARDRKNFFIFPNGSAFAIKRQIFERVGGWKEGVITEDLEMGIKLAMFNVRVKFVNDVLVYTLSPFTLYDLYFQIKRWAYGSGELFLEGLSLLRKGLTGLEGFLYVTQWGVYSIFIFSLILVSTLGLIVTIPPYFYLISISIYLISLAVYSINFKVSSDNLHKISSIVLWASLIGFIQGLLRLRIKWRVTPKTRKSNDEVPACIRVIGVLLFIIAFLELLKGLIFESIILFLLFLSTVIVQ